MKARFTKKLIAILLGVIGVIIFSGCATIKPKDFIPNNNKVTHLLPSLEPMMELNSFGNAYRQKSDCSPEILCSAYQKKYYQYETDASVVYLKDVNKNIIQKDSLNNQGYLVLKLLKYSPDGGYGFWGVLNLFTLTTPAILGAPLGYFKSEALIEVEVRNIKNEIIATYTGHDKFMSRYGYYYGSNVGAIGYRKCNIGSLKCALDEVKIKISADYNSLIISLNKSLTELQQERELASKQSGLEPGEFLNGNGKYNEKDFVSAIKSYNSVLDEYPCHKYALYNRGNAQINLGSYSDAIKNFTRLIELDPKNAEAFYYRGVANENLSEMYGAIYDFDKAIALNPEMALAYFARGFAEENLTLNAESVKDYQHALKINPELGFAKERLSIVQSKIEQAKIEQIRQAEVDRAKALNDLNVALNSLNNYLNTSNSGASGNVSTTTSSSTGVSKNNNVNVYMDNEAKKQVEQEKKHSKNQYDAYIKLANKEKADADYYQKQFENAKNDKEKIEASKKFETSMSRCKDLMERADIYK